MKRTLVICTMAFLLICSGTVNGQIRVIKKARGFDKNPTLVYNGITGDTAVSAEVGSLLRVCGWFDLAAGQADYSINGTASESRINISIKSSAGPSFDLAQTKLGSSRETAKAVVDGILKAVFKVQGICRSKIAFCGESGYGIKNIFLCDIDGKEFERLTSFHSLCVEPSWSPGGKSLLYTRYGNAVTSIIETQINPLRSRRLVGFKGLNAGGEISPNGKYLALILSKDGSVDLYVKMLESSTMNRLTRGPEPESSPCWSPSGGKICYASGAAGRPELYIINANGGSPTRLKTEGSEATSPEWSTDNKIVYACRLGKDYAIALYDLDNPAENRVLTSTDGSWESPSWAPDNRHVVCSRTYGGRIDLYIVDSWTGKTRKLIGSSSNLTMPAWSPIR